MVTKEKTNKQTIICVQNSRGKPQNNSYQMGHLDISKCYKVFISSFGWQCGKNIFYCVDYVSI